MLDWFGDDRFALVISVFNLEGRCQFRHKWSPVLVADWLQHGVGKL